MGKLKTLHYYLAPESVLSNRGQSRWYTLDQVFAGGISRGYISGGFSAYTTAYLAGDGAENPVPRPRRIAEERQRQHEQLVSQRQVPDVVVTRVCGLGRSAG